MFDIRYFLVIWKILFELISLDNVSKNILPARSHPIILT